jgi:sodium/potassium-transporting ATPase subunit alpha
LFYFWKPVTAWTKCRWEIKGNYPEFYWKQQLRTTQICYTTDALKNAQSAFFVCIVMCQMANLLIHKSRTISLGQQGMTNSVANFSFLYSFGLACVIIYIPWVGQVLGGRMLAFPHFMCPALAWFCIILFYDEVRKVIARRGIRKDAKTGITYYENWVSRNALW